MNAPSHQQIAAACLSGASQAPDMETEAYYLAISKSALVKLEAEAAQLRLVIDAREAEMVRRAAGKAGAP